jgi:DMSO/TMAO reductase YedYZ heme-binding membrane subunit
MKLFGINLGSFGVATGIIGMYLLIIIILSSLGWIETKKGIWRRLHYLGYLAVVFIFFHVLYTGSDVSYGFFRMVWILVGILLILAVLVRLYRAGTIRHKD